MIEGRVMAVDAVAIKASIDKLLDREGKRLVQDNKTVLPSL